MAVVGTAQKSSRRPEGTFELGKFTVRTFWRVQVNDINDGPQIVASAPGLPLLFSFYSWGNESNVEMLARQYEPAPTGTPPTMMWEVAVVYSTPERKYEDGRGGGSGKETPGEFTNPTLELPIAKFKSAQREVLIEQIYDNTAQQFKPCTASNGEVFDPPPKRIQNYQILEITRNEPTTANHPALGNQYGNAVNSDWFWGLAPGSWKCKSIDAESQNRQIPGGTTFPFLRVTYTFESNPDGWALKILDYGNYYWKPDTVGTQPAKKIQTRTMDGKPTAVPLNGRGQPLPDRVPFTSLGADNAVSNIRIGATTPPPVKFSHGAMVQVTGLPSDANAWQAQNAVSALPPPSVQNGLYFVSQFDPAVPALTFSLTTVDPIQNPLAADVIFTGPSSGPCLIWQPGVWFTINPYNTLPYAALSLPADFSQVQ